MKYSFRRSALYALLVVLLCVPFSITHAEENSSWGSRVFSIFNRTSKSVAGFSSADELTKALREALAVSAERALTELGQQGGFADSDLFRIPLPKRVESFRQPLALIGQDYRLDDFQATMNRAAEEGVAAAPTIVKKSIQGLAMEGLNELWKGEDDAITRFLEKQSRAELAERMLPLIAAATDSTGATRSYKAMEDALPAAGGGLFSKFKSLAGVDKDAFDLDTYINEQALNSLFNAMALEEKVLREDPLSRSTDLLKKLFGDR